MTIKNFSVAKVAKYTLSFLFYYRLKTFIRNYFSRPVFYDIFVRTRKRDVCIIAPYFSRGGFIDSVCVCTLAGNEIIISPTIIDDPEKNCLVVLYPLPVECDISFTYTVKKKGREIFGGSYEKKSIKSRHKISIATLFKYETDFLKEWIDYHLEKGIEHFYLYENNDVPDKKVAEIISPYVVRGLVTHIMWPYAYKIYNYYLRMFWPYDAYSYSQLPQINHAIYKFSDETEWILSCDVDEYFYSPTNVSFDDLLDKEEKEGNVASVRIPGIWFGAASSDLKKLPINGVLKSFTLSEKIPTSPPKCVFNTERVLITSVHNSLLRSGEEVNIPADVFRFNHYRGLGWKRRIDETFAREVKNIGILRQ